MINKIKENMFSIVVGIFGTVYTIAWATGCFLLIYLSINNYWV